MSATGRSLIVPLLVTLGLLLALELVLRVGFHYPRGYFRFMAAGGVTLYPPSTTLPMRWGAIPYEVRTNALGFRGDELALVAPPGRQRVLAIGDSVTDGFFADNEATYPAQLQRLMQERGRDVEVINAARGGGSIDKEYAILKEHGFPLRPDVVVLTFVTNDIFDIRERSLDNLLTRDLHPRAQTVAHRLLTETALGEWANDLTLRLRFRAYRAADRPGAAGASPGADSRYDIWGGDHFQDNVRGFRQLTSGMDSMVLEAPFSAEVNGIIEKYVTILERMKRDCEERRAQLFFVYFPAYSQVYDPGASLAMRDILEAACAARSIPFVDLTGNSAKPRFFTRSTYEKRQIVAGSDDLHRVWPNSLSDGAVPQGGQGSGPAPGAGGLSPQPRGPPGDGPRHRRSPAGAGRGLSGAQGSTPRRSDRLWGFTRPVVPEPLC